MMRQGRWLEVINLVEPQRTLVQTNWRLSWNLGWCHFKLDRFDEARKHFVRAARLAPRNPACQLALGSVYLKKRQFKKAEVILEKSLRTKEIYATRVSLVVAYMKLGRVADAENLHLEAIKHNPDKSEVYAGYAEFLSDIGHEDKAQMMSDIAEKLRNIN